MSASALDRFRALVRASGLSTAELARRTGRSRQSLVQSLTETVPRLDTVEAVLHALGSSFAALDHQGATGGPYVIAIHVSDRLRPVYAGRSWRERPVELVAAKRFATRDQAEAFLARREATPLDPEFRIVPVLV